MIGTHLRSVKLERLRLVISVLLFGSAFYFMYQGASTAFAKDTLEVADYLMLTFTCVMLGSLIHKVKKTVKEESEQNG